MRFAASICSLASVLSLGSLARAGDGVLEINQARALAGSVTPGDAPGFPVEIHTRGSFRLTGDLSVPAGAEAGIAVYASGTRIDLNGFAITSTTVCSGAPLSCTPAGTGIGIDASGATDVSIENGLVSGFGVYGASLFEDSRADRLNVQNNAQAGLVTDAGCVLTHNIVRRNGGPGIQSGPSSRVESNVVRGNKGVGASLGAGTSFGQNVFEANAGGSVSGGRATEGNVCDDGRCSPRGTRRFYYVTQQPFTGAGALARCAAGFHMASAWEIFDLAALEYATHLGYTLADSGTGLPTSTYGWARSGLYSVTSPGLPVSMTNCAVWTSAAGSQYGTAMQIPAALGSADALMHPWQISNLTCSTQLPVWCIED